MRFVATCVVVGVAATAAAQDWNQWRGPSRTGVAASFVAPAKWPDRPTRAWQAKVCEGHSSPVASRNRVFILSRQADELKSAYAPYCRLQVSDEEDGWILMTAGL